MGPDRLGSAGAGSPPAEVRYDAVFESGASGLAVTSPDGRFLAINPALCRMLGQQEQELLGRNYLDITHPEDRDHNRFLHRQLLDGEIPSFVLDKRFLAKDGEVVWTRVSVSLIRDPEGRSLYTAATIEDITSQRVAAEQLALSQSLLRVGGRLARVGGWAIALPSREVFWSDEVFEILDLPRGEEPPLEVAYELYPGGFRHQVQAAIDACVSDGTPFDLEVQATATLGRALWVRIVGEAERAADGAIVRVNGAIQDISELKAARAHVEEVADRLTTSLESMTDAFYLLDREWRFTYLNARAEELLERDRGELLGGTLWEAFPETVDHPVFTAFHHAADANVSLALEDLYYAPLQKWFSQSVYPSSQGLAVYFRDVTDQHEARLALERREVMLEEQARLLDETQEAIFVQDLGGIITYWNRGAERIYGFQKAEAVGRAASEVVAGTASQHRSARRAVVTEGRWNRDLTHTTQDGREVSIETRWTLLRGEAGAPRAILVTDSDVTDRRRMERQLIRSQRIESLGTLAGGIAHDLNNVLAPILLGTELLAATEDDPQTLEMLRAIEASAERGAAMVRQVLSFARGVEGDPVDLDVTELFTAVLRIAAETFPRDIRFSIEFSPSAGWVRGDETQLHQVLMNLLVNARDAMPDGGTITCCAYAHEDTNPPDTDAPTLEPGHYVVLEVADDGRGMPPEVMDRVFEPFFTTKRHGEGTGLGLSTSMAIVQSHGGHIEFESQPGAGTIARVYLPTLATHGLAPVPSSREQPARGTGEWVLVVDDETQVRAMMRQTLQHAGYRVLTACEGAEAVALYRLRHDDIALVITDLMMPVMGGSETIEALRAIDPTVRIIAASGLTERPRGTDSLREVAHVLSKPFTGRQLLEATASALGEGH